MVLNFFCFLGYKIAKREMSGKSWEDLPDEIPEFCNEFTIANLKENSRYLFRVAAVNAIGEGEGIQNKESIHIKRQQGLKHKRFVM